MTGERVATEPKLAISYLKTGVKESYSISGVTRALKGNRRPTALRLGAATGGRFALWPAAASPALPDCLAPYYID